MRFFEGWAFLAGFQIIMTLRRSRNLKLAAAPLLALWLGGCANLGYYAQAVNGQMDILRRAQPISSIAADPNSDTVLKQKLARVTRLRAFASRELGLPDNNSYASYADLQRPYVLWNVVATPELSTKPKQWCFIGAGCVKYRGFFSQTAAEAFAQGLRGEGYDTYVGGVPAYSTLGWLNDPVLNTFIGYPETELARLIFHELAHQAVYVADDSVFNESFATAVELEGVSRWLDRNGTPAQRAAFDAAQQRKAAFTALVLSARKQLDEVFESNASDSEKRAAKAQVFAQLQREFAELKATGNGYSRYDRWFARQLNNAHLASVATYTQLVPGFRALLARQSGDMRKFYAAVKEIGKLPEEERAARLPSVTGGLAQR
jgi:predicted aminopeptidase